MSERKVEVIKRKCTSFFDPKDRIIIQDAAKAVHVVLSEAVHLVKADYLRQFEAMYKDKETQGVDDTKAISIDDTKIHYATLVMQGTKPPFREQSEATKEKKAQKEKEKEKNSKLSPEQLKEKKEAKASLPG
jgi:hypothetical protein